MTQIEQPKVVRKKLFSPIWLLPLVALALGGWLGVKSIRESGIDVRIHFPSASGIDVGKTLVRYQGLNVGKVVDVAIDDEMKGVNVDLVIDYRAESLLRNGSKFWLVTPKASITGVEGLDALFSGNYIGVLPGEGDFRDHFEAEQEAPPLLPGSDGLVVELSAEKLGSLDVGSPVFYRQIPVGEVVSYRLDPEHKVLLKAYVQKQYAPLVRKDSRFWNVSGVQIDASLAGIKVNTASLASLIAGGINFSSPDESPEATANQSYKLYASQQEANGGVRFMLTANDADGIKPGTDVVYRGVTIGEVEQVSADEHGVAIHTRLDAPYSDLLGGNARFWREGADISLAGLKHAARLVSGDVIAFLPGNGQPLASYPLDAHGPDLQGATNLHLTLTAEENPGIGAGAEIRFRQIKIGEIKQVSLATDFASVRYQAEILPEFKSLLTQGSDFVAQRPLDIDATMDGINVHSADFASITKGAVALRHHTGNTLLDLKQPVPLFASADKADSYYLQGQQLRWQLYSDNAATLSAGAPVYYKKMQIGQVNSIEWQAKDDRFAIALAIDAQFKPLLQPNTVFWQNQAVSVDASLAGLKVDVAPLKGALKGSISLGQIAAATGANTDNHQLFNSELLARSQGQLLQLSLPATAAIKAGTSIRYLGSQIGEITQVTLSEDLQHLQAKAYLYGRYAAAFLREDAQYRLAEAQVSLNGIQHPEALLSGAFVAALPGSNTAARDHFAVQLANEDFHDAGALVLTLQRPSLGSVKVGTGIFFRGIQIGQVAQYQLSPMGDGVLLTANIGSHYRYLLNSSSRFYDLSGIKVDVGLFSGAQIETGSLETILTGGIGVATELDNQQTQPLAENALLPIYAKAEESWHQWQPKLLPR